MAFPGKTQSTVAVAWLASTDNVGVAGYRLYRNGTQVGSTTLLGYTYTGLACGTSYTFALEAYDAAGNASNRAEASGSTSTDPCGSPSPPPPPPPPPPPSPPPPPPPAPGSANRYVSPSGSDAGSCTQAAPCRSLDRAYRVAQPGDVVEMAAGTYPDQDIPFVPGRVGPAVDFVEGGRVILGGLSIAGDYVTVRGIETTYKGTAPGAGNQQGVWVDQGASYVTLIDVDAGSVGSWMADHLTVRGGDYGPCHAVTGLNVCGNNKQDVSTDVLIENAYFHDLEYDASAPGAHWECMYLNGSRNTIVRGNRFERCAIFDLFVTISGPDARVLGHQNLTIENNYFAPATNGLGDPSRGWSSLSLAWCQNAAQQPAFRNILIQNNDFAAGRAGIEKDLNADAAGCSWSNVLVKANHLVWQGCQNGWVYEYNVFYGGTGCGPSNAKGD